MKIMLYIASRFSHLLNFHGAYLSTLQDLGYIVHTALNGAGTAICADDIKVAVATGISSTSKHHILPFEKNGVVQSVVFCNSENVKKSW